MVSANAMAALAGAINRIDRLSITLTADVAVLMEHTNLSKLNLVVQSICLAIAVRVWRVVRNGWGDKPITLGPFARTDRIGHCLPTIRILNCDDLVFSATCGLRAQNCWRHDLSD